MRAHLHGTQPRQLGTQVASPAAEVKNVCMAPNTMVHACAQAPRRGCSVDVASLPVGARPLYTCPIARAPGVRVIHAERVHMYIAHPAAALHCAARAALAAAEWPCIWHCSCSVPDFVITVAGSMERPRSMSS